MRVMVVDDEPAARLRLRTMLEELDIASAGEAANGLEALERIAEQRPDILLLDIAMPEVSGFDVVRHLGDPKPLVVFQTAYDEYALQAFEHDAIDYVLKPVTLDRLRKALDRARARLDAQRAVDLGRDLLQRLEAAVAPTTPRRHRLLVRDGTTRLLLPLAEILRFSADLGSAVAHTRQRIHHTDYTLAELEERLGIDFLRASRGDLVNAEFVIRLEPLSDGSAILHLADNSRVRVSRRRSADVRRRLEG